MNKKIQIARPVRSASRKLRLGFVPLTDCAPLVMAQELGLFKKYGLSVALSRELGWATIRDKIIHRELDAAHALAAMPMAITLGLGSIACDCLTALVLNLNGNAITLSNDLRQRGVRDGKSLREEIIRSRRDKTYTFGVVFPFSSHRHLLRHWFATHGIDAERDVRIVVVPPPQMVTNLKAGHLDGFCVGEPWNSVAVQSRVGWIAATSSDLDARHPEKVLLVRREFAVKRGEEHVALAAAVLEACEFCDQPENHDQVVCALARPEYIGAPESALYHGISGALDFGHGDQRVVSDFCVFHRDGANEPSSDKAAWALDLVRSSGLCPQPSDISFAVGRKTFRPDIFEQAVSLRNSTPTPHPDESQPTFALA
jgi:ABC-type nitrate/sulfonate/bicarbonate transport system substrate-binding protein